MNNKTITFLSSRGRGINADLMLMHDFLSNSEECEEYSYRFFSKSERTQNPMANAGALKARKSFSVNATDIVCIDNSLTGKMEEEEGTRILLSLPYEYQFKNYLAVKEKNKDCNYKTFQSFTHIIPGSPFSEELLKSAYELEYQKILPGVAHPLAWDVCQNDSCEKARKKLEFYFPDIKDKKVLSLMMSGDEKEQEKFFRDFSLDELMEHLGPDWLVLTTSTGMRDCSFSFSGEKNSFGYINLIASPSLLVYVADVLITNEARFATAYAGKGKPIYCPKVKKNFFEKFMDTYYSDLVLKKATQMLELDFQSAQLTKAQDEFCKQFWYPEAREPYSLVKKLFTREAN